MLERQMARIARPAIFLDRDGTIIVEREYLADPAGVELVPGAAGALKRLADAGFLLVIVTNQSGIARGRYSIADFQAVQARLQGILADQGVIIDATYFCPHHPDFSGSCDCRKPGTGMYRQAARDLGADFSASFFVGDRAKDVEPAIVLGGNGILVLTGYGATEQDSVPRGTQVVPDLRAAADVILRRPAESS